MMFDHPPRLILTQKFWLIVCYSLPPEREREGGGEAIDIDRQERERVRDREREKIL